MLEVISTAQLPGPLKLRSSGDGRLVVDGSPQGFKLTLTVLGGAPVAFTRAGSKGAASLVGKGSQVTVDRRTEFWTTGETSTVHVTEAS